MKKMPRTRRPGDEYFYTIPQVAELFQRSEQTVRRWVSQGLIEAIKVGRMLLISEKEIQRVIKESQRGGG